MRSSFILLHREGKLKRTAAIPYLISADLIRAPHVTWDSGSSSSAALTYKGLFCAGWGKEAAAALVAQLYTTTASRAAFLRWSSPSSPSPGWMSLISLHFVTQLRAVGFYLTKPRLFKDPSTVPELRADARHPHSWTWAAGDKKHQGFNLPRGRASLIQSSVANFNLQVVFLQKV